MSVAKQGTCYLKFISSGGCRPVHHMHLNSSRMQENKKKNKFFSFICCCTKIKSVCLIFVNFSFTQTYVCSFVLFTVYSFLCTLTRACLSYYRISRKSEPIVSGVNLFSYSNVWRGEQGVEELTPSPFHSSVTSHILKPISIPSYTNEQNNAHYIGVET